MQDVQDDGATVPIYYESRLAKLDINRGLSVSSMPPRYHRSSLSPTRTSSSIPPI